MNNKILGLVAALPLAVTGTIGFTDAAQAAGLSGAVNFSGGLNTPIGNPNGVINFSDSKIGIGANKLNGTDGIDDGVITGATGSFASLLNNFNYVVGIKDLAFDGAGNLSIQLPGSNPFVNFGSVDLFGTGSQLLTFVLTGGKLQTPATPNSNATFTGYFSYGGNTIGNGHMGFSSAGVNGYNISISVPEPATLLGLGVAGLALVATRRRQDSKN